MVADGLGLERLDHLVQLARLGITVGEQPRDEPAQPEMLAVEHLEIEVGIDLRERHVAQDVRFEIGRHRRVHARNDGRRAHRWRRGPRRICGGGAAGQRRLLGAHALDETLTRHRREQLVREVEAVHRVLGIERHPAVFRGDAGGGEFFRERRAADEQGNLDARRLEILRGHDHLLRGLDEQSRQAEGVRLVGVIRGDEVFRRHFDAEVDHAIAVVAEDDLDEVLADVVDVTLHGGQHHHAARGGLRLLHVRLEVRDRRLHRLRRLQHLGDDELVVIEEPSDLVHAAHERPVDDGQRGRLTKLGVQILEQSVAAALDDVAREPLVQRKRLARRHGLHAVAEVRGERGHGVGAAVFQQIFGQTALFLWNGRIALQPLGVDDRVVEAGLGAVIEEDAVQDFSTGRRQPE